MRTVLVLSICLGLAPFAGGAQPDEQGNQQNKKKGEHAQHVPTQPSGSGKGYKAGPGTGPHVTPAQQPSTVTHYNAGKETKWRGPASGQAETNASGGNISGNAGTTKSGKAKFSSQTNVQGIQYQKKHFDLQTNVVNTNYKSVTFNQNYHIAGAYNWKGPKYQVFVNYHPIWHDQWWWRSHHNHIVFIFGGWYYWNAGYWYPAWGYDPGSVYYFDGPIYASSPEVDPGQVVANVQAALQQQGYYQGEIDGILGPETRAALADYQSAQGLEPTGAVDEPTLETLGMA